MNNLEKNWQIARKVQSTKINQEEIGNTSIPISINEIG